jgi:hypothetical protein
MRPRYTAGRNPAHSGNSAAPNQLSHSALSARCKKECHGARDMRPDLGAQRRQRLSKQRAHQHRQQDQLDKMACGGGPAVRGECW